MQMATQIQLPVEVVQKPGKTFWKKIHMMSRANHGPMDPINFGTNNCKKKLHTSTVKFRKL